MFPVYDFNVTVYIDEQAVAQVFEGVDFLVECGVIRIYHSDGSQTYIKDWDQMIAEPSKKMQNNLFEADGQGQS